MHLFVASDLDLHYLPKSHYKECLAKTGTNYVTKIRGIMHKITEVYC